MIPLNIYKVIQSCKGKKTAVGKTYTLKHQAIRFRNNNRAWFRHATFEVYEFPVGEGKLIE